MKLSISFTVTFIFALAIVTNAVAFAWLISIDSTHYKNELNNRYSFLASTKLFAYSNILPKDKVKVQFERLNMQEIKDPKQVSYIVKNSKQLAHDNNELGSSALLLFQNKHYLYIVSRNNTHQELYMDLEYTHYKHFKNYILAFLVFTSFAIAYVFIIRKLYPLKALKKQINKFAQGQFDKIENVGDGEDEISEVAKAFYDASVQISKMNSSRKLFLRNIMHELKTPITKGRITIEMIEEGKYKLRLRECFLRLETLINEFASIEQITSGLGTANKTCTSIENVLEEAKDKSMCDDKNIQIDFVDSYFVNVDFKLFATAIKNMIDNAIKYSPNRHVKIIVKKDKIEFLNCGKGLDKALEHYQQAFMRSGVNENGSCESSFGLGLYIVSAILKAHNLKLEYSYINDINCFSFVDINTIKCDKPNT